MRLQDEFIAKVQESKQVINKILYFYADNLEERKDLRQEILSQAWLSYPTFRGNSKFSTWLYRIGINTALSILKKENRNLSARTNIYSNYSIHPINQEQLLQLIIGILNEVEKSIVLSLLEGYNRKEISEIMGITEGNLRIKIFRIRKKLKEYGIEKYIE